MRPWILLVGVSPLSTVSHSPSISNAQKPVNEIRALSDLIKSFIDKIEESCLSRGQIYPSANNPYTLQSEAVRMAPDVQEYGSIVVAAAAQLSCHPTSSAWPGYPCSQGGWMSLQKSL